MWEETKKHRIFILKIIYTYIYNWKFEKKKILEEEEEDKECCASFNEWVCRFARLSDCLKQKQIFVVVSTSLY